MTKFIDDVDAMIARRAADARDDWTDDEIDAETDQQNDEEERLAGHTPESMEECRAMARLMIVFEGSDGQLEPVVLMALEGMAGMAPPAVS